MLFPPGSPQSSPHLISLVAPNYVVKHGGGRARDWHSFQKKMTKRSKRVAGKEKKAKGKVQQHYLTTQSQFRGLTQKSQGRCTRSTPALGPVSSSLMNSKKTQSRI